MSRKKFIYAISAAFLLLGGIALFFSETQNNLLQRSPSNNIQVASFKNVSEQNEKTVVFITNSEGNIQSKIGETGKNAGIIPASTVLIPVSISVGSSTYSLEVPRDTTVYDAMRILASSSENFNFKSKYFPGLGYFIEQINQVRNSGGHYWTLYVNGRYSNVGASQYKPAGGDKVEWRYEKFKP